MIGYIVAAFFVGMFCGWLARPASEPEKMAETNTPILVKRTRPSFRSPAQTAVTKYEEYKTSSGLYAPIRPGRGSTAGEKDVR